MTFRSYNSFADAISKAPKLRFRTDPRLTVIDLFSGAGGAGLGFRAAGFSIQGAVEKEASAAATYRNNLRCNPRGDICGLTPRDFWTKLALSESETTVLIGCPPCQGFSTMRNDSGASDDRNRLVVHYLEYVAELSPLFTVFENVPGMIMSEHGRVFHALLNDGLTKIGYGLAERVIDAANYGVPQHRRRLIMLAGRNGVIPPFPKPTHGDPESHLVREGFRPAWCTVRDAIGGLPPAESKLVDRSNLHNHVTAKMGEKVQEFIREIPKDGGSRKDLPRHRWLQCHQKHSGHADVFGRSRWDSPANTLTTGCTNPSKGRFVHPEADRGFTYREAAFLQGFPENFIFYGKRIAEQIGNAVPPPLAWSIAEQLKQHIARLQLVGH